MSVSYAPVDVGADTGNLSLVSDDATNPQTVNVPLSGSGVDVAAVCEGLTSPAHNGETARISLESTAGVLSAVAVSSSCLRFTPAEVIDTTDVRNRNQFRFRLRNLDPVPCRVRVRQGEDCAVKPM